MKRQVGVLAALAAAYLVTGCLRSHVEKPVVEPLPIAAADEDEGDALALAGAGIENIGNTCYLNAAFQELFYDPGFRERLRKAAAEIQAEIVPGLTAVETAQKQAQIRLIEGTQVFFHKLGVAARIKDVEKRFVARADVMEFLHVYATNQPLTGFGTESITHVVDGVTHPDGGWHDASEVSDVLRGVAREERPARNFIIDQPGAPPRAVNNVAETRFRLSFDPNGGSESINEIVHNSLHSVRDVEVLEDGRVVGVRQAGTAISAEEKMKQVVFQFRAREAMQNPNVPRSGIDFKNPVMLPMLRADGTYEAQAMEMVSATIFKDNHYTTLVRKKSGKRLEWLHVNDTEVTRLGPYLPQDYLDLLSRGATSAVYQKVPNSKRQPIDLATTPIRHFPLPTPAAAAAAAANTAADTAHAASNSARAAANGADTASSASRAANAANNATPASSVTRAADNAAAAAATVTPARRSWRPYIIGVSAAAIIAFGAAAAFQAARPDR